LAWEGTTACGEGGVGFIGFVGLIGFIGFVGLVGFVEFVEFVGLVGFVGFVEFVGFVGFVGLVEFEAKGRSWSTVRSPWSGKLTKVHPWSGDLEREGGRGPWLRGDLRCRVARELLPAGDTATPGP
jgi:hypothetical protein